jgi:hypothetical protein
MNKVFLLAINFLSKWLEVYIINNITSSSTIAASSESVLQGMELQNASDNGSQFKSETFKIFTKMNHIKHIFTPPYHSKANGLAENGVRNFKNCLHKILNGTIYSRLLHGTSRHNENQSRWDYVWEQTVTTSAINNPNKASSSEFKTGETVMVRDYTNPHNPPWRQSEVRS